MELKPKYRRVIGLDIHQQKITTCVIMEQDDGTLKIEHWQFGIFKRDRHALAEWAHNIAPDEVVMESSTRIYWKSLYAALEHVGIIVKVVKEDRKLHCCLIFWCEVLG